jgi:ATP-binding protein involved in chromosome partitioning
VALLSVRKSINFAKTLKMRILGIVENMSGMDCPHCGKRIDLFKTGGGEKAAKDFAIPFLGQIPIDPRVVEEGDKGVPFVLSQADSPVVKAFNQIVEKIEKHYEEGREEV